MNAVFVIPGEAVGKSTEFECGDGVYERDGQLFACTVGERVVERVAMIHQTTNNAATTVH